MIQKQLTARGNHPLLVNCITYLLLSVLCVGIARGVEWAALPPAFWFYSLLGGMAGATGNAFLVKALQSGDLSVLGPINAYKSVIGIIVGIAWLGEVPNVWGVVGIAFIIYGSYFVLDTPEERFSLALLKKTEIKFRIWAMVLSAIEAVIIKKIIFESSATTAFISWCWFGALFSVILLFVYRLQLSAEMRNIKPAHAGRYALLLLSIGTMQLSTNYTFGHMPVGYALSLFQLSTLVAVLAGYRIFKEENILKKLLGSAIMIVGSVIIILMKDK